MRKHTLFMSYTLATAFVFSSYAQADISNAQFNSLEQRVSSLEQKKTNGGMINPVGRPEVRDGADLFFTGELLVWQSHVNGLSYGLKTVEGQPLSSALYNSTTKNMHFDWDCGFRVGMGWNTPHDGWDLGANWTWFGNQASRSADVSAGHMLVPTNNYSPGNADVSGFSDASASWRLHLNMIDLELGREFFVSKWMTLRPFMGVETAWVRQKFIETFTGAIPAGTKVGSTLIARNNYWGIGPKLGMNTQWGLGCGFSFVGNGSVSLLYGNFQIETLQKQLFASASNTVNNNSDGFRTTKPVTELVLGIRWDKMFSDDRLHFGLQVSWDNLMFYGQNQFKNFEGRTTESVGSFVANQGDLSIQGWNLSARLDF